MEPQSTAWGALGASKRVLATSILILLVIVFLVLVAAQFIRLGWHGVAPSPSHQCPPPFSSFSFHGSRFPLSPHPARPPPRRPPPSSPPPPPAPTPTPPPVLSSYSSCSFPSPLPPVAKSLALGSLGPLGGCPMTASLGLLGGDGWGNFWGDPSLIISCFPINRLAHMNIII